MMEERKVPALRFQGFTDKWEKSEFKDVFFTLKNNTLSRAELHDTGTVQDLHYGDILTKFGEYLDMSEIKLPFITNSLNLQDFKSSFLQNGDVVMADTAEDKTVGKCSELANINEKILLSGLHTIPLRPLLKFASGYLGDYLNSPAYHDQLLPLMQGTKVTSISRGNLMITKVKFPSSITEQDKIAKYFLMINKVINSCSEKCNQLIAFKKSMLEKMFPRPGEKVPEVRFRGFTGDWGEGILGEMASFSKGSGYSKSDLQKKGTPVILYGRLYTNYETLISHIDTFVKPKSGSVYSQGREVIVPASGETAEDISRASVIGREGVILGGDLNIIYPKGMIHPLFLAISISHGKPHKDMAKRAQGKTIVHLRGADLAQVDLLYPSIDEQKQIGLFFYRLEKLIAMQQRKLEKLQSLKQAMLSEMFI